MKSVIRWPNVLQVLGFFCLALGLSLVFPLLVALYDGDRGLAPLLVAVLVSAALGVALAWRFGFESRSLSHREGFLLVLLTWLTAGFLGAIPFYLSSFFNSFTDAFFESISGFTTTGATVLSNIEALPRSLLLWRSFTHWLGGMGIILLGIAILPLIGTGGMELYRAEFSGARSEKLTPRIAETANALWRIYAMLTVAGFLALMAAGMSPFDSICHAFSALGTGGFSTRNGSIESFQSPMIEMVLIVLMFVAGINFTQHYRLFIQRNPYRFLRDRELRAFALIIVLSTAAIAFSLVFSQNYTLATGVRKALFQVVSIATTTGFSTANFELWAPFPQLVLLALMFAGGCTGSTAGGLKISRIHLLLGVVRREFRRMVERRGVFAVYSNGQAVPEAAIQSLLNLVYLAFLINFTACILLTAFGVDVLTAIAAVAASMFNIGPGLGAVGPADNYGHFPALVKWTLAVCMLAGRLEFYTLLVIFTTHFWKK